MSHALTGCQTDFNRIALPRCTLSRAARQVQRLRAISVAKRYLQRTNLLIETDALNRFSKEMQLSPPNQASKKDAPDAPLTELHSTGMHLPGKRQRRVLYQPRANGVPNERTCSLGQEALGQAHHKSKGLKARLKMSINENPHTTIPPSRSRPRTRTSNSSAEHESKGHGW